MSAIEKQLRTDVDLLEMSINKIAIDRDKLSKKMMDIKYASKGSPLSSEDNENLSSLREKCHKLEKLCDVRKEKLYTLERSVACRYPKLAEEMLDDPFKTEAKFTEKMAWQCSKGHEYTALLGSRVKQNSGCPYCSNHLVKAGYNDMKTTNFELAKELIGDATKVFAGTSKKLKWKCSDEGHEYEAIGHNRLKGSGCPYCAKKKVLPGFNDLVTIHPEIAKEAYDWGISAKEVLAVSGKKRKWKCPMGHVYEASPRWRVSAKRPCKACNETRRQVLDPKKVESLYDVTRGQEVKVDAIRPYSAIQIVRAKTRIAELMEDISNNGQIASIAVMHSSEGGSPYVVFDGVRRLAAFRALRSTGDPKFSTIRADIYAKKAGVSEKDFQSSMIDDFDAISSSLDNKLERVAEALAGKAETKAEESYQPWTNVPIVPDLEIRARGDYGKSLDALEKIAAAIRAKLEGK
jgi:hypothetical protein